MSVTRRTLIEMPNDRYSMWSAVEIHLRRSDESMIASPGDRPIIERYVLLASSLILRYGLVVVVAWIGALKYTDSEAVRIQQHITHSPFMSWMADALNVRALSNVLGTVEIIAALLVALGPWLPHFSAVGSALACLLFLTTLSFLFTTPGVGDPTAGGFPALSPLGQFLLKDLVLLGASLWTLGESIAAARLGRSTRAPGRPA